MLQKSYRKLYCPVPQEQRPLNEYLNIKNSFFFNWPTLKLHKYIYQLIKFGLIILFFSIFITNFFYYFFEFPNKFVLLNFDVALYFKNSPRPKKREILPFVPHKAHKSLEHALHFFKN